MCQLSRKRSALTFRVDVVVEVCILWRSSQTNVVYNDWWLWLWLCFLTTVYELKPSSAKADYHVFFRRYIYMYQSTSSFEEISAQKKFVIHFSHRTDKIILQIYLKEK